jgi:outer membrane protein assembly factor BamB
VIAGRSNYCVALLCLGSAASGADWPQFRGPGGSGVSPDAAPVTWDGRTGANVRWVTDLPGRGVSSPVVARGRIYVTACTGTRQDRLHVLCLDAATGKRLWERQFWATGNTLCNPRTCMAAPTPATDGDRAFALFASGDLAALDRDGNLLWYRSLARDYPQITNQVGMAASPVLCKDVLLLALETPGESFAAGLDTATGKNRWKLPRPRDTNWVTPLVRDCHGCREALFLSANDLTAYDPATGRELWAYRAEGLSPTPSVPSLAAADGLLVTGNGVALRPGQGRDGPAVAWKTNKLRPAYASPLCHDGRLYAVSNNATVLDCFDLKDGKVIWQQRVKGPFSASPVAAGGKLYLVNEEGVTTVIEPGPKPRVLATNPLGEQVLATPALAGGAIFLRSDRHLTCIAERAAK